MMKSLLLRNLFFTILQPGVVAGLIPYLVIGNQWDDVFVSRPGFPQYAAVILFATGFIILLNCIYRFASEGRGTLSPLDPTRKLVMKGLYKYSRNPMYIGVILMLIAEAILFRSVTLWIYSAIVFSAFNLFILLHEEPRMRRDFGDVYLDYCRKVRRWI
jgi:protein-S-isoprenylcysteine O-methyltransferase Ste14